MIDLLLWPFHLIWWLIGFVFSVLGVILAAVVGFVLIVAGLALTATIIGAVFGVPLIIFGILLGIRAICR